MASAIKFVDDVGEDRALGLLGQGAAQDFAAPLKGVEEPESGCITSLGGLAEALTTPGAMACFARGVLNTPAPEASGSAPSCFHMPSCPRHGHVPTHGLTWVPAPAAAGLCLAAAALQILAVPLPLRALVVTSLSPPESLPLLLSHLSAACTSDGSSDAKVSVPTAA